MAIQATVETSFGEERELYIRLNNVETNNHGVTSHALFRGFLSQQAFEDGKHFVWERQIEFTPDVSQPIWPQAYAAVKTDADLSGAVDV
jgi:hypothetical protein